jgi:hypothetical protein
LYHHVVVGLKYVTEIRPYLMDIPQRDGTSFGRMQRVVNLDINFYDSLGVIIGRNDSEDGDVHLEEIPFRVPGNLTGNPVPLFNGEKHISYPEGFDRNTEYFIRQEQPLPMTILGVVDTVEVFE